MYDKRKTIFNYNYTYMDSESKIQSDIVKWYNNSYCLAHHLPRCLIFSIPNGGDRSCVTANLSKSTGEYPGASDLVVIHYGALFFVEVKDAKSAQKPKQIEFQKHVEACGFPYYLVRSLDEFKLLFK